MAGGSEAQKKAWLPKLASRRGRSARWRWPKGRARPMCASCAPPSAAARSAARSCRCPTAMWPTLPSSPPRASAASRSRIVDLRASGVTREPVETIDPSRSHARIALRRRARRGAGRARRGRAPAAARAGSRRRAVRLRAGRRRAAVAGDGARLCARALRLRPPDRLVPGDQAQARRRLRRDRAGALQRLLRRLGAGARRRRSCRSPPPPPAISASEAYFLAAKENIQMHGGMGFTWEFDCHLYYRRAKLLSLALGSTRLWKDRLITQLETANAPVVSGREAMDFDDTPEEADVPRRRARLPRQERQAPRAGRRHGLPRRQRGPRVPQAGQGLAGEEGRRRLCRHHLAEGLGRARRHRRSSR